MTPKEINQKIQDIQTALSANPEGRAKELLEIGLQAFSDMLLAEQKKSESQPIEKLEQLEQKPEIRLPTKEELQAWQRGMEKDNQNQQRVSVGRASEIVVTIPTAEVKIGNAVRDLTQSEIISLLKTYFKRVATGGKMKNGQYTAAYASEMGKTVWRLFDGWNLIYQQTQEGSEFPPMVDIFPGWENAQQAHKVTADVLWRWASNRKE